jgi:hypothetical protein
MSTHHHLDPDPRAELADYLRYLISDADRRPLDAKINDDPQHNWLEQALDGDEEELSDDHVELLAALTGDDPRELTYAEASRQLAEWCREYEELC